MNTIIYLLLAIIIIYVFYYSYKVRNIEGFTNDNQEDEPTETTMDNSVEGMLRQLEILKESMPKTNKIVQNDFKGPNAFIPYVINNLNKTNFSIVYLLGVQFTIWHNNKPVFFKNFSKVIDIWRPKSAA